MGVQTKSFLSEAKRSGDLPLHAKSANAEFHSSHSAAER